MERGERVVLGRMKGCEFDEGARVREKLGVFERLVNRKKRMEEKR